MLITCESETISIDDIPEDLEDSAPGTGRTGTLRERKADAERAIVLGALQENGWHITETAAALGLADHSSLLKIMRRHQIKKP
jgi:transcriptional regulator of acetoin/glycerol metabolism